MVAPPGFEPGSQDPESQMMDHYTTGLLKFSLLNYIKNDAISNHRKSHHHQIQNRLFH